MGTSWSAVRSVLVVGVLLLPACGGSSSLLWDDHDRTLVSLDAIDGFVRSDGHAQTSAGGPIVGDMDDVVNGRSIRMFYSFDISGIPGDALIDSAVLHVYQESVEGTPYPQLSTLVVDHVTLGGALDAADYNGGTLTSNIGALSTTAALEWKTLTVTAAVQTDVNSSRTNSEFRLRFTLATNLDGGNDWVEVNDGADTRSTGHLPQLVLHYRTPRL